MKRTAKRYRDCKCPASAAPFPYCCSQQLIEQYEENVKFMDNLKQDPAADVATEQEDLETAPKRRRKLSAAETIQFAASYNDETVRQLVRVMRFGKTESARIKAIELLARISGALKTMADKRAKPQAMSEPTGEEPTEEDIKDLEN